MKCYTALHVTAYIPIKATIQVQNEYRTQLFRYSISKYYRLKQLRTTVLLVENDVPLLTRS